MNSIKQRARWALAWAVRSGKVIRPEHCEGCGKACKPQGHHSDYTLPLAVNWYCIDCHVAAHPHLHGRPNQKHLANLVAAEFSE